MKKNYSLLFTGVICLLTFLSGCRKELNIGKDEEIANTPLPGQPTYCRIESIWENPGASNQRYILVLYDVYENPTAITTPLPTTGHPYYTFKYDSWHRLREFRGEYANGNFETWHFYGYDLNGRIGVDTSYRLGAMGSNGPASYFERSISKYTYDSQGRMIKNVTDFQMTPSHTEKTYNYDAAGNLIYPPGSGVVYDNKQNLNRTNDIWQFLNEDYSVNNPFIADSYNSSGFPTVINSSRFLNWVHDHELTHSQISYSCREAHW